MKLRLLALLLVSPLFVHAQAAQDRAAPSCGLNSVKFDVRTARKTPSAAPSDTGNALIYFLEDDRLFGSVPKPTARFGIDGEWVGATHGSSWFSLPVASGEHHLCANWQSRVILVGSNRQVAALHFNARAGKTYFFRIQNIWSRDGGLSVNFTPIDSDEGQILIGRFAHSAFSQKK
jgi:hypothetical protein